MLACAGHLRATSCRGRSQSTCSDVKIRGLVGFARSLGSRASRVANPRMTFAAHAAVSRLSSSRPSRAKTEDGPLRMAVASRCSTAENVSLQSKQHATTSCCAGEMLFGWPARSADSLLRLEETTAGGNAPSSGSAPTGSRRTGNTRRDHKSYPSPKKLRHRAPA